MNVQKFLISLRTYQNYEKEDIVLLERTKRKTLDEEIFKFEFTNGGEFDMVIYNKKINKCQLYEIKYSNKINKRQARYLKDFTCCNIISKRFGEITDKYVIYRGENKIVDGIQYINVENYLSNL